MTHDTRRTLAVLIYVCLVGGWATARAEAQVAPEPTPAPATAQVAPVSPSSPAPAQATTASVAAPGVPTLGAPPPASAGVVYAAPPARRRANYDGPPLLFGPSRVAVGGYGGFGAAYTRMLNRDGAVMGFEGALLIAHRLSLGVAGYGFSRTPQGPADLDGAPREFGAGYGGFVGRYAFFTSLPVYASVGVLVGGGAVVLHRDDRDGDFGDDWDEGDEDWDEDKGDGFFVVQPELSLHANLTRWMRLGITGGYRITSGVQRFGLSESDLNGVVLGGNIQFGWI